MLEELEELMGEFLADGLELVEEFERTLVAAEKDLSNRELIKEPKRIAHTLNGTAGMFDCRSVQELAEASEKLLAGALRCSSLLSEEARAALREAFAQIRAELHALADDSQRSDSGDGALLDTLHRLCPALPRD